MKFHCFGTNPKLEGLHMAFFVGISTRLSIGGRLIDRHTHTLRERPSSEDSRQVVLKKILQFRRFRSKFRATSLAELHRIVLHLCRRVFVRSFASFFLDHVSIQPPFEARSRSFDHRYRWRWRWRCLPYGAAKFLFVCR